MNRPQFFFETPEGYRDESYVRPFPDRPLSILPGEYLRNVVVQLDLDAPQIFRTLFVEGVQQDQIAGLHMQVRDAYGNSLTDGFVPLWMYVWGAGSTTPDGGSGRAKVFESELYCPAGSVILLDFFNAN